MLGASAGGLEAFQEILRNVPTDTGLALVLMQNLDPRQHSLLGELLSRCTSMPAVEAKEGMAVQPNHVYVIPPNAVMRISVGAPPHPPRTQASRPVPTGGGAAAAPEPFPEHRPELNVISKREREVLRLIVDGKSTRDIATELGVSFKTAACHRANLMSKLDVHETASLIVRAVRWGLVSL